MDFIKLILASIIFCLGLSCTKNNSSNDDAIDPIQVENSLSIFSPDITVFRVNVIYELGAEPYTGALGLSGSDTWDVTQSSFQQLFSEHSNRTIQTQSTLNEMTEIPDQGVNQWNSSQLVSLGESVAPSLVQGTEVSLSIIFVNGTFNGSNTILGVQIGSYPFAFIFKDVVVGVGGGDLAQKYVEQATVVHEVGHAIGLVNNGVPMVIDHEDRAHPHHTTNENCVMYWAVESSNNILTFLTDIITGGQLELFGTESLQDARAFMPQ